MHVKGVAIIVQFHSLKSVKNDILGVESTQLSTELGLNKNVKFKPNNDYFKF